MSHYGWKLQAGEGFDPYPVSHDPILPDEVLLNASHNLYHPIYNVNDGILLLWCITLIPEDQHLLVMHTGVQTYLRRATSVQDRMSRRQMLADIIESDMESISRIQEHLEKITPREVDIDKVIAVILQFELRLEEKERRPYWHANQEPL